MVLDMIGWATTPRLFSKDTRGSSFLPRLVCGDTNSFLPRLVCRDNNSFLPQETIVPSPLTKAKFDAPADDVPTRERVEVVVPSGLVWREKVRVRGEAPREGMVG